jgi:hypothetical protein
LRTLLVATAIAGFGLGWVAYHLNWIRQRHDVLSRTGIQLLKSFDFASGVRPRGPWALSLFGEAGYAALYLQIVDNSRAIANEMSVTSEDARPTPLERSEIERLCRMFPEAYVGVWFRRSDVTPWPTPPKPRAEGRIHKVTYPQRAGDTRSK